MITALMMIAALFAGRIAGATQKHDGVVRIE
jgi:hypothetical protein